MQLAKQIADEAIARSEDRPPQLSDELRAYMKELGRLGGKAGGPKRKAALSKKRRVEIARKAARARWKAS